MPHNPRKKYVLFLGPVGVLIPGGQSVAKARSSKKGFDAPSMLRRNIQLLEVILFLKVIVLFSGSDSVLFSRNDYATQAREGSVDA